MRIDIWLKENDKAPSRSKARELIINGCVYYNKEPITKCSFEIEDGSLVSVKSNNVLKYVSRGGLKLEKAINDFRVDFNAKRILDIGSSTGGFTDCALQNGAANVVAIDVGNEVMHKDLRNDKRISLYENTNVKDLDLRLLENIDYIVCDISFISLERAFENIIDCCNMDMILLIKPQFECGKKGMHNSKGIVNSKILHFEVIKKVQLFFNNKNYHLTQISHSPITGGDGNIEFITYFSKKNIFDVTDDKINNVIEIAHKQLKKR